MLSLWLIQVACINMAPDNKKQIPLRISEKLYGDLLNWAEDDFRSVNGQIEYLLTECVKQRKKNGRHVPKTFEPAVNEKNQL